MARVRRWLYVGVGFCLGIFATLLFFSIREANNNDNLLDDSQYMNVTYKSPLIFVGGFPRSGTTLMRILLDTHPDVRCGPETRVIPRILSLRKRWNMMPKERKRLQDARLLGKPIDKAVAAFILELIRRNGPLKPRLCNKDPLSMKFMKFLSESFPNCKFILMIRDGRAVAHSVKKRSVTIFGIDWRNPWDVLKHWERAMILMMRLCQEVGPNRCFAIKYENLVLQPRVWLKSITSFLNLEWSSNLLNHNEIVESRSSIVLSRSEKSTNQVVNPINTDSLTNWASDAGVLSKEFIMNAHKHAPLLKKLGYDVEKIPPYYGEPDPFVVKNSKHSPLK